jgi:hypothetical protein
MNCSQRQGGKQNAGVAEQTSGHLDRERMLGVTAREHDTRSRAEQKKF